MQLQITSNGKAIMIDAESYQAGEIMPRLIDHPEYLSGQKDAAQYAQDGDCLTDQNKWMTIVSEMIADLGKSYHKLSPYSCGVYSEMVYYSHCRINKMIYFPAK